MAKNAIVRARVEEDIKKDTEKIFKELGFTMSDAINIFLRRCRVKQGIPFELEIPNEETRQAIEDSRNGIGLQKFNTIEEMFEVLDKD
jgi:DNA-damage-inducible protein J